MRASWGPLIVVHRLPRLIWSLPSICSELLYIYYPSRRKFSRLAYCWRTSVIYFSNNSSLIRFQSQAHLSLIYPLARSYEECCYCGRRTDASSSVITDNYSSLYMSHAMAQCLEKEYKLIAGIHCCEESDGLRGVGRYRRQQPDKISAKYRRATGWYSYTMYSLLCFL